MYSARGTAPLRAVGFPIRTSPDHSLVGGSPRLFAASHVLLRLRLPRHPPCALRCLVTSSSPRLPTRDSVLTSLSSQSSFSLLSMNSSVRPLSPRQLSSFVRLWWSRSGSNRRHPACKAGALPAELRPLSSGALVGLERFELSTPRLSSVCSNQLSYRPLSDLLLTHFLFKEPRRSLKTKQRVFPQRSG
jgi:hypothetical protein